MKIQIEINRCPECRHIHYIGGYGSSLYKHICTHSSANRPRDFKSKQQSVHAQNFIEDFDKMPDWCPLKKGGHY